MSENAKVTDFRKFSKTSILSNYRNPIRFVLNFLKFIFLDSARFQLPEKYNHAYILKILNFGVRDAECLLSLRSSLLHENYRNSFRFALFYMKFRYSDSAYQDSSNEYNQDHVLKFLKNGSHTEKLNIFS